MTPSSFDDIRRLVADMPGADAAAIEAAQARDGQLTKPPGSLGKLEQIALWLAGWQASASPRAERIEIMIFAGNHGVTAQGISAFPPEVTFQMVANFEHGGAAINQLAALLGAELTVVPLELDRPTRDFCAGPAMTEAETCAAFAIGFETVKEADLACIGEMGIGNTTVAAALSAALFGGTGGDWAGPGTGLDPEGVNRKAEVIDRALALHGDRLGDPLEALACLGGREIAAMAGALLACRHKHVPVILDGYVNCAAAAVLKRLDADALDHCIAGHRSAEPAAGRLLGHLDADRQHEPLLDLEMRLGEGSGAATAALLVKAAVATHNGMATFAEAGVAGKES
ncbi:MAG: nicotinate-nucleotide--dimethylbenzimidazole phosphoribosyltransferase [Alphaproteobacteria bacterium]|jgi:nicotinate-nucleotide--dimethylbenzimidazole phosphoribosyltransferase|nr:nicotinate-nucleotide--dimethylbenzimidazole phosphoribosyltransferase [Rhodospirillaceae bacterium]MDG2479558.1 nicotinate-nucleotide--dimethylbenzimidazole phosphoribosyltransferase [Alphaproteobacteria bacterium]